MSHIYSLEQVVRNGSFCVRLNLAGRVVGGGLVKEPLECDIYGDGDHGCDAADCHQYNGSPKQALSSWW